MVRTGAEQSDHGRLQPIIDIAMGVNEQVNVRNDIYRRRSEPAHQVVSLSRHIGASPQGVRGLRGTGFNTY